MSLTTNFYESENKKLFHELFFAKDEDDIVEIKWRQFVLFC
jgi:hypothetical protein